MHAGIVPILPQGGHGPVRSSDLPTITHTLRAKPDSTSTQRSASPLETGLSLSQLKRSERLSVSGPGSRRCRGRKGRSPQWDEAMQLGGGARSQPGEKGVCCARAGPGEGKPQGREKGAKRRSERTAEGAHVGRWLLTEGPAERRVQCGCTREHRARCLTNRPTPLGALRRGR